ncbi:MAG: hypothetical protein ACYCW6_20945, partial [Candidatus Xenobia bacterium]
SSALPGSTDEYNAVALVLVHELTHASTLSAQGGGVQGNFQEAEAFANEFDLANALVQDGDSTLMSTNFWLAPGQASLPTLYKMYENAGGGAPGVNALYQYLQEIHYAPADI